MQSPYKVLYHFSLKDFNILSTTLKKSLDELEKANIQLEADLKEKEKIDEMRKDFISNVSHEIKTPLSVIQGYADLLQNKDLSEEKRKEYTYRLSRAIESLTNLVTNILKLNKIENQGIFQKEKMAVENVKKFLNLSEHLLDQYHI